ncbi:hypothetical protein ACWCQ0_43945, partial [Streptomyces massasporeus]
REDHRDRRTQLYAQLATDPDLDGDARVRAAEALAGVAGHWEAGADRLIALATDPDLYGDDRVQAAAALAGVDGYRDRATQLYAQLATDPDLDGDDRVQAAEALAGVAGHWEAGADRLTTPRVWNVVKNMFNKGSPNEQK